MNAVLLTCDAHEIHTLSSVWDFYVTGIMTGVVQSSSHLTRRAARKPQWHLAFYLVCLSDHTCYVLQSIINRNILRLDKEAIVVWFKSAKLHFPLCRSGHVMIFCLSLSRGLTYNDVCGIHIQTWHTEKKLGMCVTFWEGCGCRRGLRERSMSGPIHSQIPTSFPLKWQNLSSQTQCHFPLYNRICLKPEQYHCTYVCK